jgi:ribosome-associated protein
LTIPHAPGYSMTDSGSDGLFVTNELSIPRSELTYRATRAGGAGGQHVNTSSTRIELLWDVEHSAAMNEEVRQRLTAKLAARLNAEGMIRVVASERRSQMQNRIAAEERLADLVRRALAVPKKRRATKPGRAAKERRLQEKKRHSDRKKNRRGPDYVE